MPRNLISNGNFETGNFQHWTVTESDGNAKVVVYKDSYRAKIGLGKRDSVMLDTGRFRAGPEEFKLFLQASVPELKTQEAPRNLQDGPIIFCTLFGWGPSQPAPIYTLPVPFLLSRPQTIYEYHHSMRPGVEEVQLIIGLLSSTDPAAVGPIYLDNVKYIADLPD
ncbi:hypothetical protein [Pseudomonas sp. 18173]|uniref:hypothetical protein n=1 Tax=Pseudomonas sp. 18173 TaxID=3390055 RepID=UPI003D1ECE01